VLRKQKGHLHGYISIENYIFIIITKPTGNAVFIIRGFLH